MVLILICNSIEIEFHRIDIFFDIFSNLLPFCFISFCYLHFPFFKFKPDNLTDSFFSFCYIFIVLLRNLCFCKILPFKIWRRYLHYYVRFISIFCSENCWLSSTKWIYTFFNDWFESLNYSSFIIISFLLCFIKIRIVFQ